jgi:multicomponent Na+:H+ antiporter subunit F
MLATSVIFFCLSICLSLVFVIVSKDIPRKLQASGLLINFIVLLMLSWGFYSGRPEFIDLIIVFILLNLIGIIGFLRFAMDGNLLSSSSTQEKRKF